MNQEKIFILYSSKYGIWKKLFKTREVTGGWKKLHDDVFHNLYSSENIIKDNYG
jgi:hypothetical protein